MPFGPERSQAHVVESAAMPASELFGTDGIRGRAGEPPLDDATIRAVGQALTMVLTERLGRPPRIVVGRDTRESGRQVESALAFGVRAAGGTLDASGVITTPGVAAITRLEGYDAGVVVSASHNPFQDNGIKVFAPNGAKLDEDAESAVERLVPGLLGPVGTIEPIDETPSHTEQYYEYLRDDVARGLDLAGLSLAVDCANGAAYTLAPRLFRELGATVHAIGVEPDGRNINRNCGSLHLEGLAAHVAATGADLGVAFDGDADRALFVDDKGNPVDGDRIMHVLALDLAARGELEANLVVATVMSNMGLEVSLREHGISLVRTPVGDKYVLEELRRTGASLGGEQSGHVIFPRISLAGDGIITSVELLFALRRADATLSTLAGRMPRFPQVLVNVRVREKRPFDELPELAAASADVARELEGNGRLLLRYSGTENLARVMIEGPDAGTIGVQADRLVQVIRGWIGE